jgi:hypothetical protein
MGIVELAGLAERAGRLVKLQKWKKGCVDAMSEMERNEVLTNRLSARIVNEDEEWVTTFDETISSADARSGHLPRKRYKAVTCLHDF